MKSIVLRLVLVLAAFSIIPNALAADGGNVFVDATFGETFGGTGTDHSGTFSNAQTVWGADGGYLWKLVDEQSLGFEVGYMHFGHIPDNSDAFTFSSNDVSARATTLGARFQYLFGDDKASIFQLRAGLLSVKFDGSFSTFFPGLPATTVSGSYRQSGLYFGIGIGRYITQGFSLILAYNQYASGGTQDQNGSHPGLDLDWLGLEAEYRFY